MVDIPIYEKENAFQFVDDYDQIGIIDADIYIRPDAKSAILGRCGFGAVVENSYYYRGGMKKIVNYSYMHYERLHDFGGTLTQMNWDMSSMGMILLNCQNFKPYLQGQTPKEFLMRSEFKDFVDGVGTWKWSTDQTYLTFLLKVSCTFTKDALEMERFIYCKQ